MRNTSLTMLFAGVLSLGIASMNLCAAKTDGSDDDVALLNSGLRKATIKLEENLHKSMVYNRYLLEGLPHISLTMEKVLKKAATLTKEKIRLIKMLHKFIIATGSTEDKAELILEQALQCEVFIIRLTSFTLMIKNISEDLGNPDRERLKIVINDMIEINNLVDSDAVNYRIFLRWIDGDLRDGDFLMTNGS